MIHKNIEVIGEGELDIGQRVSIQPGVQVIFHRPAKVTIADYCNIGPGVKIICDGGDVNLGEWTTLHDRCLLLSTVGLQVGAHGWFGQHTVLDGTGGLTIGNGVRVGMYSQIWSHVAAGEQIEGCTLFGQRPVVLENDVWLVGSCIVASGVTMGHRAVALIASNITKSWPAHSVVAGSPAVRKESLSFYKTIQPDEQWQLLAGWLGEIAETFQLQAVASPVGVAFCWADKRNADTIVFVKDATQATVAIQNFAGATVCCLANKSYLKRLTELEHRVLKYLSGNKARFIAVVDGGFNTSK